MRSPPMNEYLVLKASFNLLKCVFRFHSSDEDPKHGENVNFQKFLPKYYGYLISGEPSVDLKNLDY